jgi:beta-galactosidase
MTASPAEGRPRAARAGERVELRDRALQVGERCVPLLSGAVHYWRLERSAWRPALESLVRLGLPIVETYVPWGVHETGPGELDFGRRDARKDLGAFLDLAHELGLLAFVRPGPHINAELTFFGLPERIVYDPACQARSPKGSPVYLFFPPVMFPVPSYASARYHQELGAWYDAVGEIVAPRLWPEGPVALLQVDNEASFYFRDGNYCQDYHPDALAGWHAFLAQRYGTVESLRAAHRAEYPAFEACAAPVRFDAKDADGLTLHLDWAAYHEHLIASALTKMRARMERAGMAGVPFVHNLPLGDGGLPLSVPELEGVAELVGFDYYHGRREHRTIKRRTLFLAGTTRFAYAPELGVGAPPWFTPLAHDDSLYCAMTALAFGLRGFNLYMLVDRDRWYGAPIDAAGTPRPEADAWRTLIEKLVEVGFHTLERRAEVALVVPREYQRLSRATNLLGPLSPATIEAIGGTPVDGCRDDDLGFAGPVQTLWFRMLARFADALTDAGIPYVYVDGDADASRLAGHRVLITPSYEYASTERWQRVCDAAREGGTLVYGPTIPALDAKLTRHAFEVPRRGRRVLIDTPADAVRVVAELATSLELARPFRATPALLETSVHVDARGPRVLFVVNPEKHALDGEVALPEPLAFVDALSGEHLAGETSLRLRVPAQTVRMLIVEGRSEEPPAPPPSRAPRPRARRGAGTSGGTP